MSIIDRIIELSDEKNIKQIDIANKLDINKSVVANWKKRNCNPPAEYIPQIAELLNVSVQWLMTGEEQSEEITSEEKALLEHYRMLSEKDKAEINGIIELKLKNVTIETQVINSKVG